MPNLEQQSSAERKSAVTVARTVPSLQASKPVAYPGPPGSHTAAAAALHAAIRPFARADLDLVRLASRPLPATPWTFRFDAVVAGHRLDPSGRLALREVGAVTRALRIVGVYEGHE